MIHQPSPLTIPHISIPHGFFTRHGGVSDGLYESLNGGYGSKDQHDRVTENRNRACTSLGLKDALLAYAYQVHSPDVVILDRPLDPNNFKPQEADALVTNQKNICLSILTADCCPVLFYDHTNQIIGAAHAGWKGAYHGVLKNTVHAMQKLGADPSSIIVVIGPTIAQKSYEVDQGFYDQFIQQSTANARFFIPSHKQGHWMFDLPGYNIFQLQQCDIATIIDLKQDTYSQPELFFSYRRTCHNNEPDCGRLMSMICLD